MPLTKWSINYLNELITVIKYHKWYTNNTVPEDGGIGIGLGFGICILKGLLLNKSQHYHYEDCLSKKF